MRFRAPSGKLLFFSATPSDNRAIKNHIAEMRRNGFVLADHQKKREQDVR